MTWKYNKEKNTVKEQVLDHKGEVITYWGGDPSRKLPVSGEHTWADGQELKEGEDFYLNGIDKSVKDGVITFEVRAIPINKEQPRLPKFHSIIANTPPEVKEQVKNMLNDLDMEQGQPKEESGKCIECLAYNGHHSPRCSKIDLEEAKKQLTQYYELWLTKEMWVRKRVVNAFNESQKWKGKFWEVKHENNKLRKRKINSK